MRVMPVLAESENKQSESHILTELCVHDLLNPVSEKPHECIDVVEILHETPLSKTVVEPDQVLRVYLLN